MFKTVLPGAAMATTAVRCFSRVGATASCGPGAPQRAPGPRDTAADLPENTVWGVGWLHTPQVVALAGPAGPRCVRQTGPRPAAPQPRGHQAGPDRRRLSYLPARPRHRTGGPLMRRWARLGLKSNAGHRRAPRTTQLDLGAAPGGWSQVAAQRTRLPAAPPPGDARAGFVVGVDRDRTNRGTKCCPTVSRLTGERCGKRWALDISQPSSHCRALSWCAAS